jgi:integrase
MKQKAKYVSTVTQIDNLKPRAERYEIADANLRKNRIVVFPSGAKSWVFRYRFGGRTRKLTLECGATDLARARELGAAAMKAVASGIDPGAEKQEKKQAGDPVTVEGFIESYLNVCVRKTHNPKGEKLKRPPAPLRSAAEIARILKKELAPFKNRLAANGISTIEAAKLIEDVADRGAVMANRTLAACKALYGSDVAKRIGAVDPFADLSLTEESDRERALSAAELRAVWNAADKLGHPYTAIIRLLILTGQRLNEIGCLRWSEIDLDKREIELPASRTKNERSHIVPLSDSAIDILRAAPKMESSEDLVFTVTGRRLNGWSKMRERLNAAVNEILGKQPERWVLHDLRRTFATRAAEDLKIAPHIIDKILNHSTGVVKGIARIYNRAEYLPERHAALTSWASFVQSTVSGKQPGNVVPLAKAGA